MKDNIKIKIEVYSPLNDDNIKCLMCLYQPLVGSRAINIYLTLYSIFEEFKTPIDFDYLKTILKTDDNTLINECKQLEEYNLITTYFKEHKYKEYILSLKLPKSSHNFLTDTFLSRILLLNLGNEYYEKLINRFTFKLNDTYTYKNISSKFNLNRLNNYSVDDNQKFMTFSSDNNSLDESINYDFDGLFKVVNDIIFPFSLRTKENLELIGSLGSLYNVDIKSMRKFIGDSCDPVLCVFNQKTFKSKIKYYSSEMKKIDSYDISPIEFLKKFQKDGNLIYSERTMIENLSLSLKLNDCVINVLLEYVLNNNDNVIDKFYVEQLAATLKRRNVETKEQALKELKVIKIKKNNNEKRTINIPDYNKDKEIVFSDEDKAILERIK